MDHDTYADFHKTGRIISDDGSRVIGTWGGGVSAQQNSIRTEISADQVIKGSQNRIANNTQTNNSGGVSNQQVSSLIAGTIASSVGIAGMYAVKPSVKQLVEDSIGKKGNIKQKANKKNLDFKFSDKAPSTQEAKIVDISQIIKQVTATKSKSIGPSECGFIEADEGTQNLGDKQDIKSEVSIGPAPQDAVENIQGYEKVPTFKEMSQSELDSMDKTATQIEGTNTLLFGSTLFAAVKNTRYGKYSSLALSGFKLFNKGVLMTGQIPLEQELNMDGDFGKAAGHEIATFGTGLLVPLIPFVGPGIAFIDACGSAITGTSFVEEGLRKVEEKTEAVFEDGFDSGFNRTWDGTAPRVERLDEIVDQLEKSIDGTSSQESKAKRIKLLNKIKKYRAEVEERRDKTAFNTRMFRREFSGLEP